MYAQLEEYLAEVAYRLMSLPKARREEELREIRAHLLSAVSVHLEAGQTEEDAVRTATDQFGSAQTVAKNVVSAWRWEVWKRWKTAPPEVLLFGAFSVVVVLLTEWLIFAGPKLWRETVYPYTGGSLANPYMFSLFFTGAMIFAPDNNPRARFVPVMLLFLNAAFGLGNYLWMRHLPDFHNPFLTVSAWQPVWTVALPVAWAIVLGVCPMIRGRRTRQTAA